MKRAHDCVGILLAAGRSRRFGSDKLLHPLPDGTPIALASAQMLHAALHRMVAVVRPDNKALITLFLEHGIEVVFANHADSGMGASLAAGVAATAKASGWLVALADMPFIRPQTIRLVSNALERGAGLAAPNYQGRRGHPVGFSELYRESLLNLNGQEAARSLLQQYANELTLIECNDPGVLTDIDSQEDLSPRIVTNV